MTYEVSLWIYFAIICVVLIIIGRASIGMYEASKPIPYTGYFLKDESDESERP